MLDAGDLVGLVSQHGSADLAHIGVAPWEIHLPMNGAALLGQLVEPIVALSQRLLGRLACLGQGVAV